MSLESIRNAAGMTQEQLAQKIGSTRQAVANYENGIRRPRPEIAEKIASIFGLSISDAWDMFYSTKESEAHTDDRAAYDP